MVRQKASKFERSGTIDSTDTEKPRKKRKPDFFIDPSTSLDETVTPSQPPPFPNLGLMSPSSSISHLTKSPGVSSTPRVPDVDVCSLSDGEEKPFVDRVNDSYDDTSE